MLTEGIVLGWVIESEWLKGLGGGNGWIRVAVRVKIYKGASLQPDWPRPPPTFSDRFLAVYPMLFTAAIKRHLFHGSIHHTRVTQLIVPRPRPMAFTFCLLHSITSPMSPPTNVLPALLLWSDTWSLPQWCTTTSRKEPPKWKTPSIKAWHSSLQHKSSIEAVQTSLAVDWTDDKARFNREVMRCLNRSEIWRIIDQYMEAHRIDAVAVASYTMRGVQPLSYKRYIDPHINPLGITLFGQEAKDSADSPALKPKLYDLAGHMMKIAYERQSKLLKHGKQSLELALQKLRDCVQGKYISLSLGPEPT